MKYQSLPKVYLCLLASLFVIQNVDGALCMLCENGVAGIIRPNTFLDNQGNTCASKAVEMAESFPAGSSMCKASIGAYRDCCCNPTESCDGVEQPPTAPPVYNGPVGDFPVCDICKGRGRVTNPSMVINMLYLGVGTCPQYYDYGMAGLIQTHLCDPLQHYAYEPCGCGEYGGADNTGTNVWSGTADTITAATNAAANAAIDTASAAVSNFLAITQKKSPADINADKNSISYGRQSHGGAGSGGRRLKGSKS